MPIDDTLNTLSKYGAVFKWGTGLLGKSAIVIGAPLALMVIVAWSFHSDGMKLAAMILVVVAFFGWCFPFLRFCEKHPADALLDGQHWAEHQQILLATKGSVPIPANTSQTSGVEIVTTKTEQSEGAPR